MESSFNPKAQERIEELIHILQYELVKKRLKEWYATKDDDLLTGMWIIATQQYPDTDLTGSEAWTSNNLRGLAEFRTTYIPLRPGGR